MLEAEAEEFLDELLAPPPARGSRATPNAMVYERALTRADIESLHALPDGALATTVPTIKAIRQRHHSLARCLAQGMAEAEASAITGYCSSRISVLKQDPAFQELLTYYTEQKEEIFIDVHQRLAALGLNSIEELMARLDDQPEKFTNKDLMELAGLGFDRSGYGVQTKNSHTVNVALVPPHAIARIKEEVAKRENGKLIELQANTQDNIEPGLGDIGEPGLPAVAEITLEGGQGPGSSL